MKKNALLKLIITCIFCLQLVACDDFSSFKVKDHDLNQEAINSLFGIISDAPFIQVIETDRYGKRLYLYIAESISARDMRGGTNRTFAVLICQKANDEYVYYYPDYNFIVWRDIESENKALGDLWIRYAYEKISAEELSCLKEQNDWNKPIDKDRCIKIKIMPRDRNNQEKILTKRAELAALNLVRPTSSLKNGERLHYLTSDSYDRHIFFFRLADENDVYIGSYVVLFKPNLSIDADVGIMEITDLWNYQDELAAFKQCNGWDTPL